MNLCMTGDDQFCHWSYPADDKKKGKSEFAACRSVPQDYIQGNWKFGKKEQKNMNKGLCNNKKLKKEGKNLCMTGDDQFCHWSFPADDKKKGKSEFAACRSVPQEYIQGDWKFGKKE